MHFGKYQDFVVFVIFIIVAHLLLWHTNDLDFVHSVAVSATAAKPPSPFFKTQQAVGVGTKLFNKFSTVLVPFE